MYASNVMAQASSPSLPHRLSRNGATSAVKITIFSFCNLSRARVFVLFLCSTEITVSEEICRTTVGCFFFFLQIWTKKGLCKRTIQKQSKENDEATTRNYILNLSAISEKRIKYTLWVKSREENSFHDLTVESFGTLCFELEM